MTNTTSTPSPLRANSSKAAQTTSRAALFRANTASVENVFRLPSFNSFAKSPGAGFKTKNEALDLLRGNSTRNFSSVNSVFPSPTSTGAEVAMVQRSNTMLINRPQDLKGSDSMWFSTPDTCVNSSLNGIDLELVGDSAIRLFYLSDWSPAALHYSLDGGAKWTVPPGKMMVEAARSDRPALSPKDTDLPSGQRLWVITLRDCPQGILFVPNNNATKWDNNPQGMNYFIGSPGTYFLKQGHITRLLRPPERPIILVEKSIEVQKIGMSWNPPLKGESEVSGYHIYRDNVRIGTLNMDDISPHGDAPEPICFEGFRHFLDEGLMGNTTYKYHVTAFNFNGDESPVSSSIRVRTAQPDKPGRIDNFWVDKTSLESIEIAWEAPMDTGGGTVEAYRIFRNGSAIAVVNSSEDNDVLRYVDTSVSPQSIHCYHVTAALSKTLLEQAEPEAYPELVVPESSRTHEFASSVDGKRWLKAVIDQIEEQIKKQEGPPSSAMLAESVKQLPLPKLFDEKSHVLLQSFNWHSCHNKNSWYKVLSEQVPAMSEAGISLLWLPPPSLSVAPQGYMPSKLFDLNTAYGSEDMLRSLLRECQNYDIAPMLDFVANHRCGSKQDCHGQWTVFEEPAWGPWAIVANNRQGYKDVSSEQDSGEQSDCAPDINHKNQQVQKDYMKWLEFLFNDVGFKSIRIDMAPGYGVHHQLKYVESVGGPLAIGEYWSGDINTLRNYTHKAHRKIAVYDFAFYYIIRRCVEGGNYEEMRNHQGQLNGLLGSDPGLSVTFLDNHDTEHLDFVGRFANGDSRKILIGYAILLTHPGIPSIFWTHFSDYGSHLTSKITALGKIRKEAGVHSTSQVNIHCAKFDGYVVYVNGKHKTVCLRVGHADGFSPSNGWESKCGGDGWNVWWK
eukprot:GHVH01008251.1.p1 GENE.GHVH01008251.1~~GHVH01008251.1.p1  ORF type:complete len:897 (+),score=96.72 GHVH01008251.1:194-2884(+)